MTNKIKTVEFIEALDDLGIKLTLKEKAGID